MLAAIGNVNPSHLLDRELAARAEPQAPAGLTQIRR
jgi:hypothetical protein